jgi:DNA invertase Pin-like site-specific DNA recombinase
VRGPPEPDGTAEEKLRRPEPGSRDDAVREAAAAGVSIARIQKITGLAATTMMRILNNPPKPQA